MAIRSFAFALLAGVCVAHAAPPKPKAPKQDAASTQQTPESIDVDALARSKDETGSAPADAEAPPTKASEAPLGEPATAAEAPPVDAPPADAAAVDAAPTEMPPSAQAPVTDAPAPAPSADEKKTDASEKISIAASCQARATSLLDDAEKNDFQGATSAFDAKMRTALPAPKFKQAWDELAQFGKLVARGQSHLSAGEGYTVIMIPLIFEKANLVAQIACGTDGRIAGFYVKPAPMPAPNP